MTESMVNVPEGTFKIRRHRNSKKNLTDVKVEMFQVVGEDVSSVKKLITVGELCHDNEDMMVPNAKYHELISGVAKDGGHDDSLDSGTKILYAGAEYISYPDCDEQIPLLANARAHTQEAKTVSAPATKKEAKTVSAPVTKKEAKTASVPATKKKKKASPSTAKAKKGKAAATASTEAQEVKAAASTRVKKEKSATAYATEPDENIAADFNSATDDDSASAQDSSHERVIIHSDLPETISNQVTENIKAKAKGDLIIRTASLTPDASRSSNGYGNPFFNTDMYEDEDDDDDIYVPEYLDDDDDDDMYVSSLFDDDDDDDMFVSSLFDDDDDDEYLDPESIGGLLAQIRRENPKAFDFLELLASIMKNHIEGKAGMSAQDVFSKLNDLQIVQDEPGGEWHLSMQPTDEHFAIFEKFGRSRQQVMDKFNSEIRRLNKKEKAKAKNAKPNRERRGKRRHK
ncbi:MAG: hypothetical protein SOV16_06850 [Anaerobiospirillum succiniciproducens]|uniref:hypothetical protein n=1 Tax=Anaerobiospirillum succiniciproducens TaxID=13335 RepID=UPI002A7536EB|nr:hypothetical protein [Anaerobiospirillum succiniciproducens]MDY2798871.1 hypothetical protein [Anaerobiospirillum succiniciproducens]